MHYIYFNLHKKKWSTKNWKTKRVDGHCDLIVVNNATFKVSEKGRQRVLKTKQKNVHAGVLGTIRCKDKTLLWDINSFTEVTYNPYKYDSFVVKSTGVPIKGADRLVMINKKVYAKGLRYG